MFTDVSRRKTTAGRITAAVVLVILTVCVAPESSVKDARMHTLGQSSTVEAKLYLVLDVPGGEISLRLAEVELREYAFTVLGDSGTTIESFSNWPERRAREQTVESVHLLSATTTISESELNILKEETALDADQIQRYLPGRMVLITDRGLRIYIETDCPNPETFRWERVKEFFRRIWYGLTAGKPLHIRMSAVDAMSLYGVARTKLAVTVKP